MEGMSSFRADLGGASRLSQHVRDMPLVPLKEPATGVVGDPGVDERLRHCATTWAQELHTSYQALGKFADNIDHAAAEFGRTEMSVAKGFATIKVEP